MKRHARFFRHLCLAESSPLWCSWYGKIAVGVLCFAKMLQWIKEDFEKNILPSSMLSKMTLKSKKKKKYKYTPSTMIKLDYCFSYNQCFHTHDTISHILLPNYTRRTIIHQQGSAGVINHASHCYLSDCRDVKAEISSLVCAALFWSQTQRAWWRLDNELGEVSETLNMRKIVSL